MQYAISSEIFKNLISGKETLKDIFPSLNASQISIKVKYEENKIIVSGNFELKDDVIFHKDEIYPKEIFFDGGIYKNIIFRGGNFKKIFFRRGTFNGFVSIRGGVIENLMLLGGNFNHWLGTLNGIENSDDGKTKLADEELLINRFEIEGGNYSNNIWISGGKIGSLEIKSVTAIKIHCKPNDDKFFDTLKNKYTSRFNSVPKIRNLLISRYSNKDNFYHFSDLQLETLKFESFTNIGNITIANIRLEKFICFDNSDLGKTSFINCDFSNQIMYFDSSKITEISLAGTTLPSPSKIESFTKNKTQKKLALSQLKKVYQNMGDIVTATKYQAEELNTYMSTLNFGWEKLSLGLNKISNKHGQSWERALCLLICSSLIFYILFCRSLGFEIEISKHGFQYFLRNSGYFLEFINPIRKSDFLPKVIGGITEESKICTSTVVFDSVSKIINAYLIYQFVAAFRKYGKN